eukprot:2579429-Prymnesium_polylepis.1
MSGSAGLSSLAVTPTKPKYVNVPEASALSTAVPVPSKALPSAKPNSTQVGVTTAKADSHSSNRCDGTCESKDQRREGRTGWKPRGWHGTLVCAPHLFGRLALPDPHKCSCERRGGHAFVDNNRSEGAIQQHVAVDCL